MNIVSMKNEETIIKLKNWLEDNSYALLADKLGYKTSDAIKMWIKRESIPNYRVREVMKLISKGVKKVL